MAQQFIGAQLLHDLNCSLGKRHYQPEMHGFIDPKEIDCAEADLEELKNAVINSANREALMLHCTINNSGMGLQYVPYLAPSFTYDGGSSGYSSSSSGSGGGGGGGGGGGLSVGNMSTYYSSGHSSEMQSQYSNSIGGLGGTGSTFDGIGNISSSIGGGGNVGSIGGSMINMSPGGGSSQRSLNKHPERSL